MVSPTDWDDYYAALGRFMHQFSAMENGLNGYLAQFLALAIVPSDSPKAFLIIRAAVGGQRMAPLRDSMKRILRITRASPQMRDKIDAILDHVGNLQFVRDRLAHNGAILVDRRGKVRVETSNSFTVREFEQLETLYFPIQMLLDMTADLAVIHAAIHATITPHVRPTLDLSGLAELEDALRHVSAWRYKPSQLERVRPKSRAIRPTPKRPQEPSPA